MRDLRKSIEAYRRKYIGTNEGGFYAPDFQQIAEISGCEVMTESSWNLIDNALMAGFMIGYRKAQRDARKKASCRK